MRWAIPLLSLVFLGCAKKEVKPLHTEPWLAHPPASAAADAAPGALSAHYVLTSDSRVRFELSGKGSAIHGTFQHVSGELTIDLAALDRSHGHVEVALDSLDLDGEDAGIGMRAAALTALGVSDAGAATPSASFELSSLEATSPSSLDAPESGRGTRNAPAVAVGNLLLHGFRVQRRAPLEAEFGFDSDPQHPTTVLIRSRAPFVISLETHDIHVSEREPAEHAGHRKRPPASRDARVSIELHAQKTD